MKNDSQDQKKIRPKLEDVIPLKLEGEVKQAVLDFVSYCKKNKIAYSWGTSNVWYLKVRGKHIGNLRVGGIQVGNIEMADNTWYISLNLREVFPYMGTAENENLTEIIWEYIKKCEACSSCKPGRTMTILGKEFNNVCVSVQVKINNPNVEEVGYIKKLMEFIINIPHGTSSRPIFDLGTNGLTCIDNNVCVSNVTDTQGMSNEDLTSLFDGKYTKMLYVGQYSRFNRDGRDCEILFQLDEPVTLSMYSLVTDKTNTIPDSWDLYGAVSKNGNWVQLDTRKRSEDFSGTVTYYTEKAFKISSPEKYQYYKIIFKGNNYQLSQVHLYI